MKTLLNLDELPFEQSWQFPSNQLHGAFGELNLTRRADRVEVMLTVLMEPSREGAQTGVAFDGSASMKCAFGQLSYVGESCDAAFVDRMVAEGKATISVRDHQEIIEWSDEGWAELEAGGHIASTANEVEVIARDVIPYLAEQIDADGGTTAIYWACGPTGETIEVLGDLTSQQARVVSYVGPADWGLGTQLLPAMRYFVERFAEAPWGFYVFVTDGRLDDLAEVKEYTAQLAAEIAAGARHGVKCVLIGIGREVDERQLEELDDLPSQLGLSVDIWDYKIAREMRDLRDIFAEVVDENVMVAPTGRVVAGDGAVVAEYADGLPGLIRFSLPPGVTSFTLYAGEHGISQELTYQ